MNNQTKRLYFIIGLLSLLLLIVLFGGWLFNRGTASSPANPGLFGGSETGRFQLLSAGTAMNPYVFMMDTRTGRCWLEDEPGKDWREVSPDWAKPK